MQSLRDSFSNPRAGYIGVIAPVKVKLVSFLHTTDVEVQLYGVNPNCPVFSLTLSARQVLDLMSGIDEWLTLATIRAVAVKTVTSSGDTRKA